jgi:hypothetical protein
MCRRPLLKPGQRKGRAYLVGKPQAFLICRDCWKGWVIPNVARPSRVIIAGVYLNEQTQGGR